MQNTLSMHSSARDLDEYQHFNAQQVLLSSRQVILSFQIWLNYISSCEYPKIEESQVRPIPHFMYNHLQWVRTVQLVVEQAGKPLKIACCTGRPPTSECSQQIQLQTGELQPVVFTNGLFSRAVNDTPCGITYARLANYPRREIHL